MNKLVAIAFDDLYGASNALVKIDQLQDDYLISLNDAVIATIREDGKVNLNQSVNLVKLGAIQGGFWGSLIGLILTGPLGMLLIGGTSAAFGALVGSLSDYGINDDFIRELGREMKPGSSALFLLVRDMTTDKVVEKLQQFDGKIIQTSLSKDAEEKLKAAIESNDAIEIE
ncbi:MAG: DUF1269 domain-containing protein [Saprospiraceae bacterium]|nr:DUF1269 domain-containing protein [Saprospiraceae bacterium]